MTSLKKGCSEARPQADFRTRGWVRELFFSRVRHGNSTQAARTSFVEQENQRKGAKFLSCFLCAFALNLFGSGLSRLGEQRGVAAPTHHGHNRLRESPATLRLA